MREQQPLAGCTQRLAPPEVRREREARGGREARAAARAVGGGGLGGAAWRGQVHLQLPSWAEGRLYPGLWVGGGGSRNPALVQVIGVVLPDLVDTENWQKLPVMWVSWLTLFSLVRQHFWKCPLHPGP